jgi:uncharacterized RDD family membrane protein YckC
MASNPYQSPNALGEIEPTVAFEPAPLGSRAVAMLIDLAIVSLGVILVSLGPMHLSEARLPSSGGVMFLHPVWLLLLPVIVILIPLGYHSVCVARFSATPGKQLLRLKVVRSTTHRRIGLGRAAARYAASYLSAVPLGAGYVMALFDVRRRTLHDRIAGTVVARA